MSKLHSLSIETHKELSHCPKCNGKSVVSILYGMPTPEALKKAERGEVKLGGCVIEADSPNFSCKSCGYKWSAQPRRNIRLS